MFSGPPKTVPIPLLWKDLQVCILTNRCRGCAEVMLSLFLAEVMLHAEADQNDSGGEMDAGRTTACLWMEMHFVLLVHIFCSLVFLSMVFGGCVCICIGLHLEPGLPLWEGIYTCFWDRCRVRGREGTAFPFPIVKHLISPALVHFLAGQRRPW